MIAMAGVGLALGAGGTILTVSLVQAEDDAGIRAFYREEAVRRAERAPPRATYASVPVSAYAPARHTWSVPFFQQARPDGRLAPPPVELNPFKPVRAAARQAQPKPKPPAIRYDTVSGAADVTRTICVRLCDGFQAPIGHLRSQSDLRAHEALCQAANPGVPVKVFKVAAGAATIDDAVASDGKTYRALPMAYAYERGADPACRPAIATAKDRRVSLLRDFTLRPGDSIVLDGRVRTFTGGKWPYTTADFRDFRGAPDLTASDRRKIDEKVGISHKEAQVRALRRQMRVREASLHDDNYASDADTLGLRGLLSPRDPIANPPRVVLHTPFSRN
jgi:peptidoglycan hydrolase-like protein with peptidoglycan-binding domain